MTLSKASANVSALLAHRPGNAGVIVRGPSAAAGSIVSIALTKGPTMATKPNPIPDSYRRVTPTLIVQGGAKAIEFYSEVFEATERMRYPGPGGTIIHAELEIGDAVVMLEDEFPDRGTKAPPKDGLDGSPVFLFIYVDNVDAVVERAAKLGATVKRPPEDQFYGDRDAFIIDPFGHGWTVASHVEDVTEEELMKRMAEMMGG
ncbi:MAG TPA: VOC family protein [Streptosporangiaceae bacterium]|nr:VOC family protein [Streptosporangiaceae bacterium]